MKKNIAVVGSGYWGKNLVRNFYELNALKTICDLDENVLTEFQSKYPGVEVTQSFQKILDDDQIEGIIIACLLYTSTPIKFNNYLHNHPLTINSLKKLLH